MNCFNCGARLNCVDSRTTEKNTTWRRLSCPKCKEVYHSTETVDFTTKQERMLSKAQEKAEGKANLEIHKQQIIDDTLKAMAKACVIRSGYTSAITGGIYESEEDAIYDTLNELKRIYKDSIVGGK